MVVINNQQADFQAPSLNFSRFGKTLHSARP
jgi:hypothetical protein